MREIERDLLRLVAELPLADRIEISRLSRWSERAVYQRLGGLERAGLVESLAHASESIRPTRRFLLTEAGIKRLALSSGRRPGEILAEHPVSQAGRRVLLGRLDSVAVIYRLACALAELEGPPRLRWYRSQPADAALGLGDGRTLAVVRWGRTADRTAFGVRLSRLREGPSYSGALVLAPDEVRLRHARRLLRQAPFICFFALERDVAWANSEPRIWREPNAGVRLSLREALSYVRPRGWWAIEPSPRGAQSPDSLDIGRDARAPDWLLPARLKPAQKRTLDLVGDWPWIRADHLAPLLGVARRRVSKLSAELERQDLIASHRIEGRRRFVLSDRGLALLARRDRASVGAARKRWSAGPLHAEEPLDWRNLRGRRTRQLLRNLTHTEAVHGFLAALADQAHANAWRVTQVDPPQRASRYFRFEDRLHSIQPDAFGVLRRDGREQPFFLEWERRAIRPSTMAAKLAPYLRYYGAKRPVEDHGAPPLVLFVVEDPLVADRFLRVLRDLPINSRERLLIQVIDRRSLDLEGPLAPTWRTAQQTTVGYAFA